MTEADSTLEPARAVRRAVLGAEYVDAVTADPDPVARDFQDHLTATAWGAWAGPGPLSLRDRSLLVLARTAALARMEEFRLHAGAAPRAGATDAEVDELLFQIVAYCGAPAGVAARRALQEVRSTRWLQGPPPSSIDSALLEGPRTPVPEPRVAWEKITPWLAHHGGDFGGHIAVPSRSRFYRITVRLRCQSDFRRRPRATLLPIGAL